MKYRLIQKANPLEPDSKRKWYASPVKSGTINNYQLSKGIASKSSMTRGAVLNVIENMVDEIPRYLTEGYSVNLNNLGTLRLSLSSKGVSKPEDFKSENITNMRVVFTPSPEFKKTLQNIEFELSE
ncbi:MAG: HU family DNA-binding protein [Fermentimonas caenicola]|jgi:predicted histone-like DNA-binding protein|uniref:HU domain-containing protein n=1 Tax=Fermentimonas caenicola TaxID=1562970 RepID=A0A098C1W5_9BACT|nr:HU family DNA-binding protein [Lascolabacillus massiliensis]MDD2590558.1 DNA-binding domain-containing protein [Fermentimonas sp.]MDD3725211.1 DNA-binding domain-containing protein [Bacteroidales bacterium]MDI9625518.1 DNA-binding domain-containing protein [Bacteroidota bacterium]TAH60371.1 MAG: DNA-binding protein [Fermentimonas caenicola]HSH67121.1 HU family DNA-binding protein [Bacteroidia bacterium]